MDFHSVPVIAAVALLVGVAAGQGPTPTRSAAIEFTCEDLHSLGLTLIPPSSPQYAPLLAEIKELVEKRPFDPPYLSEGLHRRYIGEILPGDKDTSAILLNSSGKTVVAIKLVWRFEEPDGTSCIRQYAQISPSMLAPFESTSNRFMPIMSAYWDTILPGSKRYFGGGLPAGDNTDARPPRRDEVGQFSFARRKRPPFLGPMPVSRATLSLDGVMFDDGSFAGPNRYFLWEQIVYDFEAHTRVARLARDGRDAGIAPERILEAVEQLTGPGEDLPEIPEQATPDLLRKIYLQKVAAWIEGVRQTQGDQKAVDMLVGWTSLQIPNFRKL